MRKFFNDHIGKFMLIVVIILGIGALSEDAKKTKGADTSQSTNYQKLDF